MRASERLQHARKVRRYLFEPMVVGLAAAGAYSIFILPGLSLELREQALSELGAFGRNIAMALALWRMALGPAILNLLWAIKHSPRKDDDDSP